MTKSKKKGHVKILFEVNNKDGSVEIESMWAIEVPSGYKIDNIPFYATGIAVGDVVSAEPDKDGLLRYSGLVSPSGHSTIRLWMSKEEDVARIRHELHKMGCSTELDLSRLVSVDIPPILPYSHVKAYLDKHENRGTLEYEEACLGQSVH